MTATLATATVTRPTVAQIDYREEGREVAVELLEDGSARLTLDAGTLATVLDLLREASVEGDLLYRQRAAAQLVDDAYLPYLGNKANRSRLVVDAVELARTRAGIAGVTYDLD